MDAEVDRELALHFDLLVREQIEQGLLPADARREARRLLGDPARLRDRCRDERRVGWLEDARLDVGYARRLLSKDPIFTMAVVLSVALGAGATAAVLGAFDTVLRESLPAPDAGRLMAIRSVPVDSPADARGSSIRDYLAWKARTRSFDAMEASITGPRDLGMDEDGRPAERITGMSLTPGLLDLLGARATHGRLLTAADDGSADRLPVVIISYRLWRDRYGSDPGIIDRSVRIDRVRRHVVGVMSPDFRHRDPRVDCWTPLVLDDGSSGGHGRFFAVTGRLATGVTAGRAQADLSALAAQLARETPAINQGWTVRVQPLGEALYGWTTEPLTTLLIAVALVLVVASANIAGLLIARIASREREFALRAALGAGRTRVVRQVLTESLLLSLVGGALGLAVASWSLSGLRALVPPIGSPAIPVAGLNVRMLGLTAVLSILSGIGFGTVPAIMASGIATRGPLGAPATRQARRLRRTRLALVGGQLALAFILLWGSGLLLKSFSRLSGRDLNFDPSGLLTFDVRTSVRQRLLDPAEGGPAITFETPPAAPLQAMLDRLRHLPGVESVGGSSFHPVDSLILPMIEVVPERGPADTAQPGSLRAAYFLVTPGFFRTIRAPLVRGHEVREGDTFAAPWVLVVNESAARVLWPGSDPLGRRVTLDGGPDERPREVVGVVHDIPTRHRGPVEPVIYASYLQQPASYRGAFGSMFSQMTFAIRSAADPMALVPAARRAVNEVEPDRPISAVLTGDQRVRIGTIRRRYYVFLVTMLAVTAAALSAIGVYGVTAYSLAQRSREIGVRKALGAGPGSIAALVGRHALVLMASGLAAGLGASLALARLIASQLWGVTPTDPATYATVALLISAVAGLACFTPIRRAVCTDPTIALRCE